MFHVLGGLNRALFKRSLKPSVIKVYFLQNAKLHHSSRKTDKLQHQTKHFIEEIMQMKNYKQSHFYIQDEIKKFVHYYNSLSSGSKLKLLHTLAKDYGINKEQVKESAHKLTELMDGEDKAFMRMTNVLKQDITPGYVWLLTKLALLPDGVRFLVAMRGDLLNLLGSTDLDSQQYILLKCFNNSLKDLLSMWFSLGLFHLERVTWDSPCHILEKLSDYEAVHPIRNWLDIKKRVGPYRRCFILTHNSMPGEPIAVIHVALTDVISTSIQSIVHFPKHSEVFQGFPDDIPEDKHFVSTAIFYSIYTTQKGLENIELGTHMIKRSMEEIQKEFPTALKFSTLSPIPGFRTWLLGKLNKALHNQSNDDGSGKIEKLSLHNVFWTTGELINLKEKFQCTDVDAIIKLRKAIHTNTWIKDDKLADLLKPILMRACAYYLYFEKHRGYALNSVANFHLKNGATLWQINWKGDLSTRGLSYSCGMMANYRYFTENNFTNSHSYYNEKTIFATEEIVNNAKEAKNLFSE